MKYPSSTLDSSLSSKTNRALINTINDMKQQMNKYEQQMTMLMKRLDSTESSQLEKMTPVKVLHLHKVKLLLG